MLIMVDGWMWTPIHMKVLFSTFWAFAATTWSVRSGEREHHNVTGVSVMFSNCATVPHLLKSLPVYSFAFH